MDNYYDTCIKEIEGLINDGDAVAALALLTRELDLPYVPEPFFSKFQSLLNEIVVDQRPKSQYFETVEEIDQALMGNEALQQKAILSLERMNLRQEMTWCRSVLVNSGIQDWIKKQVLLFMMEQEFTGEFEIVIDGHKEIIQMVDLLHPQASESYQKCVNALHDELESHNPSLLLLCIGELDYMALESFPHALKSIDARSVIERVESYFL